MKASVTQTVKRHSWLVTVLVVLVLAGFGLPGSPALSTPVSAAPAAPPAAVSPVAATGEVAALQATLEAIYTQVSPSVVSIQVIQQAASMQGPQQFTEGAGSGFVWDTQGDIVTNNHVVDGANTISVIFSDGTTLSGKVVGTDPDSDLAVVKVVAPAGLLKPVTLADSTQLKVGQLAVAIGNPFGLEGSMTVGFVSSLGRLLPVNNDNPGGSGNPGAPSYSIPDVIQTDAPVNPGNSGGALVDDQGRLIGVTSAIISPVRASAGIGFAIPSAIVQKVVPVLINSGKFEHPWLGMSGTSLNPDLATAMNLKPEQRGALVVDVVSGGPAEKAGIMGSTNQTTINGQAVQVGGDVIVAINGQLVKSFDDVVTYLARYGQVNQELTLTVLRQGKEEQVKVLLAARPIETAQSQQPPQTAQASGAAWLGIAGDTVTPEIARAMNLAADQTGVLVLQVAPNGPAGQAGLQGSSTAATINGRPMMVGGDIITAFNGTGVVTLQDLQGLVRAANPGDTATLTVLRGGKSLDLSVTLGERPTQ